MNRTELTRIGIAVVESDGRFLVGRRPAGTPLAGMAEFPGGKCEADETPRACAVRECEEETGLVVVPRKQLATIPYSYEHGDVELHFWKCDLGPGISIAARPHEPFTWIDRTLLATLEFPPANRRVLEILMSPGPPAENQIEAGRAASLPRDHP